MTTDLKARSRWQSATLRIINGELEHGHLPYIKSNKDLLGQLTQAIASLNREYFYQRLQQRVKDNLGFLHKINSNSTSLVDEFGRSTYFYVNIGPYKVLIYQPGTPTFFSNIQEGSDLVVTHDSCQQNGPILGTSCGCFLADFATQLSCTYQKQCLEKLLDGHDFHPDAYEASLETCLKMFVDEDRDAHGRLLEIKHTLLNIGGEYEVKSEQLEFYFYAKDIEVYLGRVKDASADAEKTDISDVSAINRAQLLMYRDQCNPYQQTENHPQIAMSGSKRKVNFIKSSCWNIIREKILTKNGIFEDPDVARNDLADKIASIEKEIQGTHQSTSQDKDLPVRIKPSKSTCCTM